METRPVAKNPVSLFARAAAAISPNSGTAGVVAKLKPKPPVLPSVHAAVHVSD